MEVKCKIDHTLEDAIPQALCHTCNWVAYKRQPPVPGAPFFNMLAGITGPATAAVPPDGATGPDSHYDRKVKRKLKAEVKAWRERVEALERHTMAGPALAKARETLRKAETDLYMVL